MNVTILDPLTHPNWDDLLLNHDHITFFHTVSWARVLIETYGYKPLYFTVLEDGKLVGLIPVMEINSHLTGNRGVSLPFTDICHPIADTREKLHALMNRVIDYSNRAGWKYVEFRGESQFSDCTLPCAQHYIHILDLHGIEDTLSKSLRDSTRRNIRKAEKEGVEISFQHSLGAMITFYHLQCETRRLHGLPPQPWAFFKKIHEHVIASRQGFVALAFHQGNPIAGAVYFLFRNRAIYKFGASNHNYQNLRANNLVMWESIRWLCRNGFKSLHFGRTEIENQGLLQFKRGWRPKEAKVGYYRFNINNNAFSTENNCIRSSYSLFKILPISVLKLIGRVLYRHVG